MKTIITVNESMSMRGSYSYSIKRPNAKAQRGISCGYGASAAAAKAVDVAMGCDDFIIIACVKVMDLIPNDFKESQ